MILVPEEFAELEKRKKEIDYEVGDRVANTLLRMDPFEPLLKKYNIIFSEEYTHPEDKLDVPSQINLFMWANGLEGNANFKFLTDWIRNTQGNATVRKAGVDNQWFFGRAMIASITLFVEEIGRLSSRYRDMMAKPGEFDSTLTIE